MSTMPSARRTRKPVPQPPESGPSMVPSQARVLEDVEALAEQAHALIDRAGFAARYAKGSREWTLAWWLGWSLKEAMRLYREAEKKDFDLRFTPGDKGEMVTTPILRLGGPSRFSNVVHVNFRRPR